MALIAALGQHNIQLYRNPDLVSLGSGSFSSVYKGRYQGRDVAVKVSADPGACDSLANEYVVGLKLGKHENIAEMLHGFECKANPRTVVLVMEYFYRDSQVEFIVGEDPTAMEVADYALQLFKALEYIHSKEFIHRDIHLANVLVKRKPRVQIKLADFGVAIENSQLAGPFAPESRCVTSYQFRSPECVNNLLVDAGLDMWSAAVTIYHLILQHGFIFPPIQETHLNPNDFASLNPEYIMVQHAYVLEKPAPASYRNLLYFDKNGFMSKRVERKIKYKRDLLYGLVKKSEIAGKIQKKYEHWPKETANKYAGWINKLLVWENRPTAAQMCQVISSS